MTAEKTAATKRAQSKIEDILDRLDTNHQDAATSAAGERRERRWLYRCPNMNIMIEHPGGGIARTIGHARILWCEGISLLCPVFAYPGSSFNGTLQSKDGDAMGVRGVVVECRHIEGLFHEVEVKFRQRIDPHLFIKPIAGTANEPSNAIELSNLQGKILHLDDSEADARLLAHHLRGSGIELKAVRTQAEALECLKTAAFDIFLCDLNLGPGTDGVAVVKAARADGFPGPIVALTAENNPAKLNSVKAAGSDHLLAKPYQRDSLIQLMVKLHQLVGAVTTGELYYSTLGDQPDIDELLVPYVAGVQKIGQEIQNLILARNLEGVRVLCLNIHGSAPGYGFPILGTASDKALKALDASMSLDESRPALRTLMLVCSQLGLRRSSAKKTDSDRYV